VLVDSRQGSNLLYLPLDKIMSQVTQGGAAGGPEAAPPANPAPPAPVSAPAAPNDARARDSSRTRERDSR
jgi:membrane protease subunit HflK